MTTDPKAIAAGLTEAQRKAVIAASDGRDCSYTMRVRISTCEALHAKGLFSRRAGVGEMSSPQTSIRFALTPLGLAVRRELEGERR